MGQDDGAGRLHKFVPEPIIGPLLAKCRSGV
jgi:hypothetical protein